MAGRFDTATIKEQVYQILRRELVRQRYEPGEWLQENEIAERLNVSRSPVREALRMLTGEGLLVEIPKKGVYVRKLTEDKIRENFSIRCLLEVNAIQSLHDLQTEAAEALLACLSRECTAYPDRDPWEKQDEESLHALLMRLAGNETAVQIHKKLCDQIWTGRTCCEPRSLYCNMYAGNNYPLIKTAFSPVHTPLHIRNI